MTQPTAVRAYTFPNGMLMVFDQYGQQMPDYQGPTTTYLPHLTADFPGCEVVGARWDGKRENPIIVTNGNPDATVKGRTDE